jgi:alkylation response protein AidB-like acyl-CoA dehydrogenase
MNFGFTEEQELLRAEVRKFLDQNCNLEEVRKIAEGDEGFSQPLWNRMAELGWVGLRMAEEHGGVGLGWVDLVVVLEETGRTLFPSPLIATQLAAAAIEQAGGKAQRARYIPSLADGSKIGSFALLERSDGLTPDAVALEGKPDGDGFISTEHLPTIDETVRMGRARFDGVRVEADAVLGEVGAAWPVVERIVECGAVAVTAEMVGAAEGVHALTVDYAKQRVQFDKPIAQFQGVKHPLAEAYVDIESWKSLCYYAGWALDENQDEVAASVSRAKAYASEAFPRIGIDSIQLHGGIGYTWEYDAQLYLKRAKWARPVFGDADYHYERLARLGGL